MILFADKRFARVEMQQGFAADSFSYMDRDGDHDIFDLASSSFFSVWSGRAKSFWRGAGKSSRISVSPPEGIRLNHDR